MSFLMIWMKVCRFVVCLPLLLLNFTFFFIIINIIFLFCCLFLYFFVCFCFALNVHFVIFSNLLDPFLILRYRLVNLLFDLMPLILFCFVFYVLFHIFLFIIYKSLFCLILFLKGEGGEKAITCSKSMLLYMLLK